MAAAQDLPMDLPIIDLDVFLNEPRDSTAVRDECAKAATALITYGALVLHDSRVAESDNTTFLDLLEDYFAQPTEELKKDERPELSYQIGVTLENTEKPKCAVDEPCLQVIKRLAPSERPLDIEGHEPDPKCRFFWRMGENPPYETEFPGLNAPNVVPAAPHIHERWPPAMNKWGTSMKQAVTGLAEMAAFGLGLPADTFSNAAKYGPHLLAPTASDLVKYGKQDTILAGFHTDLNFLTIHGRSRYPGLHIWARRQAVGALYGGLIKAGFHEVVVNEKTLDVIERRKSQFPDRPLVRISSTFFYHLSSDHDITPIPQLVEQAQKVRAEQFNLGKDEGEEVVYKPMKVGQQVQDLVEEFFTLRGVHFLLGDPVHSGLWVFLAIQVVDPRRCETVVLRNQGGNLGDGFSARRSLHSLGLAKLNLAGGRLRQQAGPQADAGEVLALLGLLPEDLVGCNLGLEVVGQLLVALLGVLPGLVGPPGGLGLACTEVGDEDELLDRGGCDGGFHEVDCGVAVNENGVGLHLIQDGLGFGLVGDVLNAPHEYVELAGLAGAELLDGRNLLLCADDARDGPGLLEEERGQKLRDLAVAAEDENVSAHVGCVVCW
ncbi:isopenicillin N synthase and related dioxygenase [Colletotrichum tofieldiae]|nr:isopenicillin N synthase and related dioxygenase [Colletotrichum tofieldiae]